ncbi:SDR family oxidoreductase [Silvanigrella paludirubra]|uniref:SDR family oxidoreductase n=1 Tax=Silvanigrella paludirubra TaxID=2499159 RepID=A0A6N6VSJ7_9BACT|nr:SDR family oxidoreductase [Silvanigrella paludirubra]KAB8039077.1 SDR family oxidoreductase [Silvanigrella paludirubra]
MSNKKTLVINGGNSSIGKKLYEIETNNKNIALIVKDKSNLEENNYNKFIYQANATNPEEIQQAIHEILNEHNSIDEYVHLIGSITLKSLHNTSLNEWNQIMDLNLNSIYYALKIILPIMQKQKSGNIVLISSVAAQVGLMNHEAISAAKGAVESLTRSLSISYANFGIRVNCIAPSLTNTKMAKFLVQNEIAVKSTISFNAIKRIGEPEDIANTISFLLDQKSSFITGQIISVDGGLTHVRTPHKL